VLWGLERSNAIALARSLSKTIGGVRVLSIWRRQASSDRINIYSPVEYESSSR
jgi:hypothetical protein